MLSLFRGLCTNAQGTLHHARHISHSETASKGQEKELRLYYGPSANTMILVIRYFAKGELTASEMKLLGMVLALVLISVGFKMPKQDLTASHTPWPGHWAGTVYFPPPPQPAGMQGSRMATRNHAALGRNVPSLAGEATLGVSSALLGFLCQGREIALSCVSSTSSTGKGSRVTLCLH